MSNMAEVNGTDHLVRHDKETKLNGYDNEGFHSHERSEDEEESGASDEDRLRVVVTGNGHRPEDDSPPLSNGHVHEESNNSYSTTTVNGSAVIVVEEGKDSSSMDDNNIDNDGSSQKPLDTRLHHFVPVDDIDRKILNGSDAATRVTIPEDAVINFNTGRVKLKKGASNNQPLSSTNERESIPLETMLPSYEAEDKIGLGGEKAELEAELAAANHKNGLWSEGHNNAYSNPEAPFGNSEKLNGTSKSSDEISLPVNNHRKCLSSDVSDTSSEQKSTGEKLYFTEENRKLCPGWRRIFVCGLILIILSVALLLGVLAATGILLAESENKTTRYESGHSLPSIDSISTAGHSFKPRPSSSKVPQKFLPPVTGDDADFPPNSTISGVGDAVSRTPPPTVSSKVPVLNDSSHSQTIVPNALVGEFTIDENFTEDLKDNTSEGYQSLAKYIERELYGIFKRNGGVFEDLKILSFSPGSIKIKFVTIWASDRNVILSQKAVEIMKSYLRKNRNSLLAYPVDLNSIHFTDVFDECKIQKGGCSFKCTWDYNTLSKTCICQENMALQEDGKSCGPKPLTSNIETTTPKSISSSTSTTASSETELSLLTKESPGTTLWQTDKDIPTTTPIPSFITKAIVTISELFNDLATTESTTIVNETIFLQNGSITEFSTAILETTTQTIIEGPTKHDFSNNSLEEVGETTTEMPATTDTPLSENTEITVSKFDIVENITLTSDLPPNTTTSIPELETTTVKSTSRNPLWNESNSTESQTLNPYVTEKNNYTMPTPSPPLDTEPEATQRENITTIGYHIIEETTEVYTLKADTDSDFVTVNVTTPEPNTTTEESVTTSPLPVTLLTTLSPRYSTEVILTTETPVTENSKDGIALTEIVEYDTTETSDDHLADTTLATEDAQYYTTMKTEINFTDTMDLKVGTDNTPTEADVNSTLFIHTPPTVVSNETKDFEPTTDFSATTIPSSIMPPIIPQSNRTPEVRAFDDDIQNNNTFTPTTDLDTVFSTDGVTSEASTKMSTYADNSTATELDTDSLLTSSPFTTPLPTVELLSETTPSMNSSEESTSPHLITDSVTESINDNEPMTSTENGAAETTTPFTDFSEMEGETEVNTEPIMELSTQNPPIMNGTLGTTTSVSEDDTTTLQPTEAGYHNETVGLAESTEAKLNETLNAQNSTEIHTTLASINTSEIDATRNTEVTETLPNINESAVVILDETTTTIYDETTTTTYNETMTTMHDEATENSPTESTMNLYNETLVDSHNETVMNSNNETDVNLNNENTTNLYNETTSEDSETTIPNIENSSDTTVTENYATEKISNASLELNTTENPLLLTTPENMNISNSQTTFDSDTVTVIPENDDLYTTTSNDEMIENETIVNPTNSSHSNNTEESYTLTTVQDFSFPTPPTYTNESNEYTTIEYYDSENITTMEYGNDTFYTDDMGEDSNFAHTMSYESSFEGMYTNETTENGTFTDDFGNFTTDESITNETTTNASIGIECREDQFLCEPLNKCINDTFMCDGIEDCPDGQDEFECKNTCHSNFMCANSSTCIMSEARCDGIWDCENGSDEESCTPTECAKHEVMCNDGSKCIKPGHICDWKYNCLDRSDEVGCVERTTCETGGRFFCNDGLCIPWSLKCDGEHDCKEGEDEGNCTCLNDEFRCNDGKCLKSSSRCDGHQDCHDADDEMGCVTVDSQHIVSTYEPYSGTWGLLCAEDWNLDDGQYLCQELGFGHALSIERIHVSFNGTWMTMRRDNLTDTSLWTERVSFVESCTSGMAAAVECQKFACGEYTGLLHRRRRDVISSSSNQWPFIGYTSTFNSNRGCLSEILTPIWLITSAECLISISKEPFNGSDWYVRTSIGRNDETDVAQNHEVLRIITHPHSSKFRSLTLRDYDVALIRLKHALVFNSDKIGAICPPEEQVPPGITCFSGVLGTEKPRAPPPQVLTINSLALQLIDKRNCNSVDHFNNTINHRMLCTQSSEGHTICDNDEGTPLMCLTGINKWFLAGMLTYQRFCDVYSKHPAVFSNLFSMRKFLDQVTGQKQYEIPYDTTIYTIIPPTTPSPTLPETTTLAMTTEVTFTDYLTTMEYGNLTESIMEEINGTTVAYEELAREENDTAIFYSDYTTDLTNVTIDEMLFENETTTLPYGTEYDTRNVTSLEELEESKDELSTNKTHSYLTSVLNETDTSDEFNITDAPTTVDESTEFSNVTSDLSETTMVLIDLTNITTAAVELNDTDVTTEFLSSPEIHVTTTSSTDFIGASMNKTERTLMDAAANENMTLISTLDDNIDGSSLTLSTFNEATTTETSFISVFNESSEMVKPMISATNTSILMNQPLISLINDTIETEKRNFSETTGVDMPITDVLNESLEMFKPMIPLTNETIPINTSVISFMNDSTEIERRNFSRASDTDMPLNEAFNKTLEMFKPMIALTNENINGPLIFVTNDTDKTENENFSTTTNMPLIPTFNESLEMPKPITLTNETMPISKPLISEMSDTSEMENRNVSDATSTDIPLLSISNEPRIALINESMLINEPTIPKMDNASEIEERNLNEASPTDMPLISIFNKSLEMSQPITALTNENMSISQPLMSLMTDTNETNRRNISEVTATTDMPFNEFSEMLKPMIILATENITVNQPTVPLRNNTTQRENRKLTTSPTLETLENISESTNTESTLFEASTIIHDEVAAVETTMVTPNMKSLLVEAETAPETTISPMSDATETFTFEVEGEPDADLAFSIFKDSDTLKFESYKLPENSNINNTTEEHIITTTETQYDANVTTYIPFSNETTLPPNTASTVANTTEVNLFEFGNVTGDSHTELETTISDRIEYTTPINIEISTEVANTSLTNIEHYENITSTPEVITEIGTIEDPMMKMHLISEKLTVLPDKNTTDNITDCGLWDDNIAKLYNDSEDFFMEWPALGYLQMVSDAKMCPSAVISDKFVITSLNCLTSRDTDLDPEKWMYTGGFYQPNTTNSGIQNHAIKKIIPYPNQSTSIFLNEHDIVLVGIKDAITMDRYSRSVCLPEEDASVGKECFITGWNKNVSDGDLQKQFYSIPLSIISNEECNSTMNYDGMLFDYLICGSHNASNEVCQMNYGSPLFCRNENKHWEIHGILNFPGPCDMAHPTVFSNVMSVKKWIADSLTDDKLLN